MLSVQTIPPKYKTTHHTCHEHNPLLSAV